MRRVLSNAVPPRGPHRLTPFRRRLAREIMIGGPKTLLEARAFEPEAPTLVKRAGMRRAARRRFFWSGRAGDPMYRRRRKREPCPQGRLPRSAVLTARHLGD